MPSVVAAFIDQRRVVGESTRQATESKLRTRWQASGVVTAEHPTTRIVQRTTRSSYADRANRIIIKHHLGRIIAVIEIVSPGNKDSRGALRHFVEKTADFIEAGIHVLVIDLFPPGPRDPQGIHGAIWEEIDFVRFPIDTSEPKEIVDIYKRFSIDHTKKGRDQRKTGAFTVGFHGSQKAHRRPGGGVARQARGRARDRDGVPDVGRARPLPRRAPPTSRVGHGAAVAGAVSALKL